MDGKKNKRKRGIIGMETEPKWATESELRQSYKHSVGDFSLFYLSYSESKLNHPVTVYIAVAILGRSSGRRFESHVCLSCQRLIVTEEFAPVDKKINC